MNKIVFLALLIFCLSGCIRYYVPGSEWEKRVFDESDIGISPQYVRENHYENESYKVAWAGIIGKYEIDDTVNPHHVVFELTYHTFAWCYDGISGQYILYPESREKMVVRWPFRESWNEEIVKNNIKYGDLLIVYGTPENIKPEYIDFGIATYIRHISKGDFYISYPPSYTPVIPLPKNTITKP